VFWRYQLIRDRQGKFQLDVMPDVGHYLHEVCIISYFVLLLLTVRHVHSSDRREYDLDLKLADPAYRMIRNLLLRRL
jgi:hypothetical protein